ncbi:MAG: sugar phosphate isomerase/epimerase [Nitrospira sp.]|nr:sugar phosphate isomerase/epimerase [Nitrospira sp.]
MQPDTPHVHVPFERVDKHLDLIRENRFNLEIFFGSQTFDSLTDADITGLKEKLDYDPRLSFHAPFMDLSPGGVDPAVRKVTMDRFLRTLDFAEILKPSVIVFHSGYERWKYAHKTDVWLRQSLDIWRPVNERAADIGVKVAIENVFEDEPDNLELLAREMDSPNFGLCFDTGHFNLFARPSLSEWLQAIKPYILALHIHDNSTQADEHIVPGDGTFDFKTFFRELKGIECVHTIEMHNIEDVIKSMERIKTYME